MIKIGKIIDSRLKNGYRRIKYLLNGRSDVRETFQSQPFGMDSNPIRDVQVVHCDTGIKGESITSGVVDDKNRIAKPGETRLFCVDENGVQLGEIYLTDEGLLRLMSGDDYAVRYSSLETAFNGLKDDYNDLSLKWTTFANTYLPGSPLVQGTPPTASGSSQNTSDITAAKVDEIRVP